MHKFSILKMSDSLAWLMQIVLFLCLGLLAFPSQIIPYMGIGLLISLFLIVNAQPVSVFMSMMFFKMKHRRRLYTSWVDLREAVPILFAAYPLLAGINRAHMIFNFVFFISVTSVVIQGTTLSAFAKWPNVSLPQSTKSFAENERYIMDLPKTAMIELSFPSANYSINKWITELHLPKSSFIKLIGPDQKLVRSGGATVIDINVKLDVLLENEDSLYEVTKVFYKNQVV